MRLLNGTCRCNRQLTRKTTERIDRDGLGDGSAEEIVSRIIPLFRLWIIFRKVFSRRTVR